QEAYKMLHIDQAIGNLRKAVIHEGHQGPMEIGVNPEFLDWLADPVQNGGGALIDFGCYGANLMTWLMKGEKPTAVTAVLRQFKPDVYPKVEDEATLILQYAKAQAIIQASWNWPFSRKDLEIYGQTGYLVAASKTEFRCRVNRVQDEEIRLLQDRYPPYDDPFAVCTSLIIRKIGLSKHDPSSLENNMVVVEILD